MTDIEKLAVAFAEEVRSSLSTDELISAVTTNAMGHTGCATQDFMDANMTMDAAFVKVFNASATEYKKDPDGSMSEESIGLWNAAWAEAARTGFMAGLDTDELIEVYVAFVAKFGLDDSSDAEELIACGLDAEPLAFIQIWGKAWDEETEPKVEQEDLPADTKVFRLTSGKLFRMFVDGSAAVGNYSNDVWVTEIRLTSEEVIRMGDLIAKQEASA